MSLNFTDPNFGDADINRAFLNSQFISINELQSNDIFEMNYLEFLEAIARLCIEIDSNYYEYNKVEINNPEFQQYKLAFQIESLIHRMRPHYTFKKKMHEF